jgi:hypothetical protein
MTTATTRNAITARNAIVRGERIANRGPRGGHSYAAVRGLLNYLAFGRYADHLGRAPVQRSPWLDHNEQEQSHEEVLGWAKEKVHRYGYGYTYQLLLSTRDGGLDIADYNRVLKEGSLLSGVQEWVYTVHEDSAHPHAHAILFRKEKMSGRVPPKWQAAMQDGLEQALSPHARFSEAKQERGQGGPGRDSESVSAGVAEPGSHTEHEERQGEQETVRERGWGMAL